MSTVKRSPALALVALDQRVDLLVGRAALEPALDREAEHRDRRGRALAVDHAHLVAELGRGRPRALSNVPDSFAEMCSEKIRSYAPSSS